MIGDIVCTLSNTPPVYASADEAATFFSFWQMFRMGPFSFGLGVSLGGG